MRQKRAQRTPAIDPETAGKKAREKREQDCEKAVNNVLEEYNCQMSVVFRSEGGVTPIGAILNTTNIPISILVSSK